MTKRDDIPAEVREELERQLLDAHPGAKILYASDLAEDGDPEALQFKRNFDDMLKRKLVAGECFDCEARVPGWNPEDCASLELPDGWSHSTTLGDEDGLFMLHCPECDKDAE